jgi:hypothetical protein
MCRPVSVEGPSGGAEAEVPMLENLSLLFRERAEVVEGHAFAGNSSLDLSLAALQMRISKKLLL